MKPSTPTRIVVLFVIFCVGTSCSPSMITKVIEEYGFQRYSSPRTSMLPGVIVTTDQVGDFMAIRPVCWRDQAFPNMRKYVESKTNSNMIQKLQKTTFDLEAEYFNIISAKTEFSNIKKITLDLSDVSVLENSDADFVVALPGRKTECITAIGNRAGTGESIYTIVQVLKANIVYRIETKSDLQGSAKLDKKTLESLMIQLGGSAYNETQQTITGTSLHLGVYFDKLKFVEQPGAITPVLMLKHTLSASERKSMQRQPSLLDDQ